VNKNEQGVRVPFLTIRDEGGGSVQVALLGGLLLPPILPQADMIADVGSGRCGSINQGVISDRRAACCQGSGQDPLADDGVEPEHAAAVADDGVAGLAADLGGGELVLHPVVVGLGDRLLIQQRPGLLQDLGQARGAGPRVADRLARGQDIDVGRVEIVDLDPDGALVLRLEDPLGPAGPVILLIAKSRKY
jgi:hypothetical protein